MSCLINWLREWQTMLGSVLGGLVGLLAALIVANAQTRRERRAAAILVLSDLLSVVAASRKLRTLATSEKVPDDKYPLWVCDKLSWRRPKLSQLFEAETIRLVDVHASLAAHLALFKLAYAGIEESLSRLNKDKEDKGRSRTHSEVGGVPRHPQETAADAGTVASALELAARHAEFSVHYLQALVLGATPTFTRLRMLLWRSPTERKSLALLQTPI